jgi:hypothetical protein
MQYPQSCFIGQLTLLEVNTHTSWSRTSSASQPVIHLSGNAWKIDHLNTARLLSSGSLASSIPSLISFNLPIHVRPQQTVCYYLRIVSYGCTGGKLYPAACPTVVMRVFASGPITQRKHRRRVVGTERAFESCPSWRSISCRTTTSLLTILDGTGWTVGREEMGAGGWLKKIVSDII